MPGQQFRRRGRRTSDSLGLCVCVCVVKAAVEMSDWIGERQQPAAN